MQQRHSIPGMRGMEHIGFTVPNLEEAVRFFVDVVGCEAIYEMGPFDFAEDWAKENLNIDSGTTLKKLMLLRCGFGSNFEIFEFDARSQNRSVPRNSDVGGHHLAFYVDDIDAAVTYLRSKGVQVMGEPKSSPSGPSAGQTWIYFLAPWGMQLELVSFPHGKAYELNTDRRLWHPAIPQA